MGESYTPVVPRRNAHGVSPRQLIGPQNEPIGTRGAAETWRALAHESTTHRRLSPTGAEDRPTIHRY